MIKEVHISDMRTFKNCRQRWDFSSLLRRGYAHAAPQKHLWLGSSVHDALEVFYTQGEHYRDAEEMLRIYESLLGDDYDEFEKQDLSAKQWGELDKFADLGRGMLEAYALYAAREDDFEVIYPEVTLKVPLQLAFFGREAIVYAGRADGLVKHRGEYWLLEHKTATRLPDMNTLFLDEQCVAYQWGCQIDPRFEGMRPVGTIYNFLLKTVTQPPKVLQSGALSKNKTQNTTYALYMKSIEEVGYNVADYTDILTYLQSPEKAGSNFYRTHIQRTAEAVKVFEGRFLATIAEMLDPKVVIYPNPSWWSCKYCPFRVPCALVANGLDPRPALDFDFVKREPHRSRLQKRREAEKNGNGDTQTAPANADD